MTDLTEQWKKGELSSGWYYVKCLCENEDRIDYYNASFGCWTSNDKYIKQVLAPVPSYEEWQASYNCMLENEVLRLKNAQLKELLKECVKMNTRLENALWQWNEESELYDENEVLENKINEVLNA